jgi:hypothetical protein
MWDSWFLDNPLRSMNTKFALFTILLGIASAQGQFARPTSTALTIDSCKALPECAIPCVNTAISLTGCAPVDVRPLTFLSHARLNVFAQLIRFN